MDNTVVVALVVGVVVILLYQFGIKGKKRATAKRRKRLEETKIPKFTVKELKENPEKLKLFLHWLNTEGFTVFTVDDETQALVEQYWQLTREFFAKPMEYKVQYKGKPKYKDDIFAEKRQVNKGFLTIKEKEFLKLSLQDSTQTFPDIDGFEETFCALCERLEADAKFLYTTVASCFDPRSKKPVHDKDAMNVVLDCVRLGSSVSMIDYHPIPSEQAQKVPGRDEPTNKTHFPSSTHCDTGFLTMIMCSDVPALQIKDRVTDTWFMPEKICDPKRDCFVIVGKKVEQFASFNNENSTMFRATVHRVMMPYNTQRNSLLYFQDVPQ